MRIQFAALVACVLVTSAGSPQEADFVHLGQRVVDHLKQDRPEVPLLIGTGFQLGQQPPTERAAGLATLARSRALGTIDLEAQRSCGKDERGMPFCALPSADRVRILEFGDVRNAGEKRTLHFRQHFQEAAGARLRRTDLKAIFVRNGEGVWTLSEIVTVLET